jgi:hypothetical protein
MQKGSYVVCIDDSNWYPIAHEVFNVLPVKNQIYTIRKITPRINSLWEECGVLLEEIHGKWDFFSSFTDQEVYMEYHFKKSRFKEIDIDEICLDEILEELEKEWI